MLELKEGVRHPVDFILNGKPARGLAEPRMLLSDFLRQELGCAEIQSAANTAFAVRARS